MTQYRLLIERAALDFKEAVRRYLRQQAQPEELGDWSWVDPLRFPLLPGLHRIGEQLIISIFQETPPTEEIEEWDEDWSIMKPGPIFPPPVLTLRQRKTQQVNEEVFQNILLDDRRRRAVQEISLIRERLVPMLRQIAILGVTDLRDQDQNRRRNYHDERSELQEKINLLRDELDELYLSLPEGYAEQYISFPLEIEITIPARI